MKSRSHLCPVLLATCASLAVATAAAAEETEYPHAYPRTGVTKLFENERGIAWNVIWLYGVEQPYHKHRYDMAGVYLRWGPIRVTQLDGSYPPTSEPFEIPRPYFQRKDVLHKEEVLGFPPDSPQRWAIMFDQKEVQSKPVMPKAGMPLAFPRTGAEMAIDNDRVTEWKHSWQIGAAVPTHLHDKDSVQVFYEPGTLRFTREDGSIEVMNFQVGDARFIPAGTIDAEEAVMGTPAAVTIELK